MTDPAPPTETLPLVAVFRRRLLAVSETFVTAPLAHLQRHRALLVGAERLTEGLPLPCPDLVVAGPDASARDRLAAAALLGLGRPGPLVGRLKAAGPSLIHAHFATDGALALPLAKALQVPLVTTLHGYDVTQRPLAHLRQARGAAVSLWRQGALKRQGTLFLAVSEFLKGRAVAAGFPEERLRVQMNGVDLTRFRPRGGAGQPGKLLFVGRLVEKKGLGDLIAALGLLRGSEAAAGLALTVIGDGPLRSTLEAAAAASLPQARFLGAQPHEVVAREMAEAWLLVAPSVTAANGDAEGQGMALCEAQAMGLPVIATRHGSFPEVVAEGETGLLVPERDPPALAEAIRRLTEDAELAQRLAAAGPRFVARRFDLVRQTALLEERYEEARSLAETRGR